MSNNTTISDEEVIVFDESERENKKPEANTNEKADVNRLYSGQIVSYNVQRQFDFIKGPSEKQSIKKTNQTDNRQQSINNQSKLFQDTL
ncbi:unnamed protein product [Rotaria magnacalcarata]|nr:unnamed protein product [Rotaria magnacalcarata]